jgi:hypothetical protein
VIANLCVLTDQCLYQLNNTIELYPRARNTYSIVLSIGSPCTDCKKRRTRVKIDL